MPIKTAKNFILRHPKKTPPQVASGETFDADTDEILSLEAFDALREPTDSERRTFLRSNPTLAAAEAAEKAAAEAAEKAAAEAAEKAAAEAAEKAAAEAAEKAAAKKSAKATKADDSGIL